jgi:mono/diheme cytochrome c family protein
MKQHLVLILFLMLGQQACAPDGQQMATIGQLTADIQAAEQVSNGYELFKNNCYACHNPAAPSHDALLAPPFAGIKMHYTQAYPDKQDFIDKMSAFVANPTEEAALMKGPIRRFGLMPTPNVTPEQVRAIVTFIYENKVEEPAWFAAHEEEMKKKRMKN